MNKIKVVATIGNTGIDEKVISNLIENGVDVIKINMNDVTRDEARKIVEIVRILNSKLDVSVGTLVEIGSPLIRLGKISNGKTYFKTGDKIRIYTESVLGDETKASVNYKEIVDEVNRDDYIILDSGRIKLRVYDKGSDYLICEVTKGGEVFEYAPVYIKNDSNLPFLKIKDIKDIEFVSQMNIDFLSLPHVKSSDDVMQVTDMLIGLQNDHTNVIARIDNENATLDIDDIVKVSDGILIDRNSLSMEMPMERIPGLQKMIINKCLRMGKFSIASLDIPLNSNADPNRIEVQDIANAILDGVDALMINEEVDVTSPYAASLKNLESIVKEVETSIDYVTMFENASREENADVTGMIATNVAASANKLKCKAIIAPTITGYTARKISRFRPNCPIIAASPSMETVTSLSLNFGIIPVLIEDLNSLDKIIKVSENITKGLISLEKGDRIIITGGYPFKESKNTNFMKIEEI